MPIANPLIILAPGRSFTSVVCAMIGQHPQMFPLPETHLLVCKTMREWWLLSGNNIIGHGLLRDVAEIVFGAQSVSTIKLARLWLLRRLDRTTGAVIKELAERVFPFAIVEKTPWTVHRIEIMRRALRVFPKAKFLHLVRHPRGYGQSQFKQWKSLKPVTHPYILSILVDGQLDYSTHPPNFDPQTNWYKLHNNILSFLATVPPEQQMRVRGEDLLVDPDYHLRSITEWTGVRADSEAIDAMKHPERSPFARFGPINARYGQDPDFFAHPALRPTKPHQESLEGPLPWRKDGLGFKPEVKELARQFGYR